jgi:signal transduction histidine kinase
VAAISIPVFVEFFANLFVLNLMPELALQPFLILLGLVIATAESDERLRVLRTPLNALLAVIGLSLLVYSVRQLFISWNAVDKPVTGLQFALLIWLTIGILPFVYLLSLYSNYQSAFHAIDVHSDSRRARLRAKLALITRLHFRAGDSHAFGGWPWLERIVSGPTFRSARRVVADFQRSRREKERAAAEEQERLRRYTGSDETDAEGRRLDRREFKETMKALYLLADCMEGWYYNEDRGGKRYRADLLEALGAWCLLALTPIRP